MICGSVTRIYRFFKKHMPFCIFQQLYQDVYFDKEWFCGIMAYLRVNLALEYIYNCILIKSSYPTLYIIV